MTTPLTVLFLPESAYGPTNQCIGLGDLLLRRGHRVVFASESSWAGRLSPLGFEERLVDLAEPVPEDGTGEEAGDAGQFWTDFIAETAPEFRRTTTEQLATFVRPTYQALVDGARYAEPALRAIVAEVRPDVLVEDNVVLFPALTTSGAPFVRIVSCNPLEVPGPGVPPGLSGLPQDDPGTWTPFRRELERTHRELWTSFNDWVVQQGAAPLPDLEFMPRDNAASLYVYPAEADYVAERPLDDSWHRIDSSVRRTEEEYVLPEEVRDRPDGSALVYLSLGSLGGADVALMQRLVDALATSPHRFVVSMGPQADRLRLAPGMVGAATLPQTTVIPQVDLVITHGGNNTTTEALHFGKPMVLLPLFWDQYDNAQRMQELGFGIRLATYDCSAEELREAVDRLLADTALRSRLDRDRRRHPRPRRPDPWRRRHRAGGARARLGPRRRPVSQAGTGAAEGGPLPGVGDLTWPDLLPPPRAPGVVLPPGRPAYVDHLVLSAEHALLVVDDERGLTYAAPVVRAGPGGTPRRARPGDGATDALLALLARGGGRWAASRSPPGSRARSAGRTPSRASSAGSTSTRPTSPWWPGRPWSSSGWCGSTRGPTRPRPSWPS